ncbi:MAG: hypothetical protein GY847_20190 [Proteobacteria bacterium]|nr:hypothetical protein [Pseudomonadota bacterium]
MPPVVAPRTSLHQSAPASVSASASTPAASAQHVEHERFNRLEEHVKRLVDALNSVVAVENSRTPLINEMSREFRARMNASAAPAITEAAAPETSQAPAPRKEEDQQ